MFIRLTLFVLFTLALSGYGTGHLRPSPGENDFSGNTYSDEGIIRFYDELNLPELDFTCFRVALRGYRSILDKDPDANKNLLVIIDFSKSSTTERMFIIDTRDHRLVSRSLVAHGKNSGLNYATSFSNRQHSNMSSLGFYLTGESYAGKHGYSLRLIGLEHGVNDNAFIRAVVMHPADYVTKAFVERHGRLGRSFGCPAIPPEHHREIIDLIKEGTCLFIYYPDSTYLYSSGFLNGSGAQG